MMWCISEIAQERIIITFIRIQIKKISYPKLCSQCPSPAGLDTYVSDYQLFLLGDASWIRPTCTQHSQRLLNRSTYIGMVLRL